MTKRNVYSMFELIGNVYGGDGHNNEHVGVGIS